jgi:hypothetical protein
MKIPITPKSILRPSVISMAAMCASFAAWLFPTFGILQKGYDQASRLNLDAFVVLSSWYLLIFISFTIGEKLGSLFLLWGNPPRQGLFNLESNVFYYIFTLLSVIGTAAGLIRIFQILPLAQAVGFIAAGQANALKEALYEDYSIGVFSLRYLVLYPASVAIYRVIRYRSFTLTNIFNILLLALSTLLFANRLVLIATLLTAIFLVSFGKDSIRINIPKLLCIAALIFTILAGLNYSRNKGYYDRNHLSFWSAGLSQTLAYLGSPYQAAIGSAPVIDQLVAGGDQTYRDYADEEIALNTNSAFIHLHEQIGYFSWPYIAAMCLFMGCVFSLLASLGKTVFLLPCGAILYGSAELWRLDLFHQGAFIVWFVIGIGMPAVVIGGQHLFSFLAAPYPAGRSA